MSVPPIVTGSASIVDLTMRRVYRGSLVDSAYWCHAKP